MLHMYVPLPAYNVTDHKALHNWPVTRANSKSPNDTSVWQKPHAQGPNTKWIDPHSEALIFELFSKQGILVTFSVTIFLNAYRPFSKGTHSSTVSTVFLASNLMSKSGRKRAPTTLWTTKLMTTSTSVLLCGPLKALVSRSWITLCFN